LGGLDIFCINTLHKKPHFFHTVNTVHYVNTNALMTKPTRWATAGMQ